MKEVSRAPGAGKLAGLLGISRRAGRLTTGFDAVKGLIGEGKAALVIGIGCTGGQHRSVAITKALADFIKQKGYQATENHRDMTRA